MSWGSITGATDPHLPRPVDRFAGPALGPHRGGLAPRGLTPPVEPPRPRAAPESPRMLPPLVKLHAARATFLALGRAPRASRAAKRVSAAKRRTFHPTPATSSVQKISRGVNWRSQEGGSAPLIHLVTSPSLGRAAVTEPLPHRSELPYVCHTLASRLPAACHTLSGTLPTPVSGGFQPRARTMSQAISASGPAVRPISAAFGSDAVPSSARLAMPCRIAAIRNSARMT